MTPQGLVQNIQDLVTLPEVALRIAKAITMMDGGDATECRIG
jgi:hypothetical protein